MRIGLHFTDIVKKITQTVWIAVTVWIMTGVSATAQMGQVVGQVTDPAGLPLAEVSVQSGSAFAMTDPGGLYMLEGVAQENRVVVQFAREGFATTYGIVDLAPPPGGDDSDGDGIPDEEDDCPFSDLSPTVVIDGCESGVENALLTNGCTISDLVAACGASAKNHGKFVGCVKQLLSRLIAEDVISKREAQRIKRCAAQANTPNRDDDSSDDSSDDDSDDSSDDRSDKSRKGGRKTGASQTDSTKPTTVAPATAATPTFATLNKVMVPCGAAQVVDAQAGGVVEQDGFRVTFLAGSIDAIGEVEVVICPIDVVSPELGAFPGDFLAIPMGGGDPVLLETFSLMDVSLTQGGQPVNLADGQTAILEFLLPESTPLVADDTIGLWFFDTASGLWVEEGAGLVGVSSFDPARLSVVGTVGHFSWWNCDQPISTFSCVQGVVTDAAGNPVPNAQVIAGGVDYNGSSYASTDESGAYCLNVRIDSIVEVKASTFTGVVQSASQVVATGPANVTCSLGGCVQVDLMLPGASCIEGIVIDVGGAPIEGVLVRSTAGTFAVSGPDGSFCFSAPADTEVSLLAEGFFVETVPTAAAGPDCDTGGCAQVVLQEPPVSGGTTCISGAFIPDDFSPTGEAVLAIDVFTGQPVGTVGVTDSNYEFCIEGVPLNLVVFLEAQGPFCQGAFTEDFVTGPAEGDCDTPASCVVAPRLDCFGFGDSF